MTLGPALLFLAILGGPNQSNMAIHSNFGRVPLFYYLLSTFR